MYSISGSLFDRSVGMLYSFCMNYISSGYVRTVSGHVRRSLGNRYFYVIANQIKNYFSYPR